MIVRFAWLILLLVFLGACGGGGGDTTPPVLIDFSPSANATSIDHEASIGLIFNEAINHATINSTTFILRDATNVVISGTYRIIDNIYSYVRFIPSIPLDSDAIYSVSVTTGITDLGGNRLSAPVTWSFTTVPGGAGVWTATSLTDAPDATTSHTAVWTGNEMLIWGGTSLTSSGYRYNPATDSWTAMSTLNAPSPRYGHTAIWSGSEMIIWGGQVQGNYIWLNDGARYNPATDTWQSISSQNAPEGRAGHSAVWTSTQMLIWGGHNGDFSPGYPQAGGLYNPITNSWATMAVLNEPDARTGQIAVWTGTDMLIWGGTYTAIPNTFYLSSGGRYNPAINSWSAINSNGPNARGGHAGIWTGSEMIIWGGYDDQQILASGARYNPITDTWTETTQMDSPLPRYGHSAIWTGSSMIVWGGYTGIIDTLYPRFGGIYYPATDTWLYSTTTNAPEGRTDHTAIWTGNKMIVWGGIIGATVNTGGVYTP